jgi:membrane fusion protein, multidrug efflux system
MKSWWKWLVAVLVVAALAFGASRWMKSRADKTAASAAPASVALELTPADLATVSRTSLTRGVAVSGGLKAANSALVKAKVAGELKALNVREGDRVRAGQVIGLIDTTEFDWRLRQAEQTAGSAKAQLDIARRALDNNKALVNQGFISPTALQTSVSNEAAADATWQAAVAAVELARKARSDATLVAPITGVVSQRLAQTGERVAIDGRVIEIVDLSRLELEAAVPAEDVGALAVGQAAQLAVDGLSQPVMARVARINPSTQPGTRAVMVYLAVDGAPGLRQGLFGRGSIRMPAQPVLAVPASAVRNDLPKPYLLVVENDKAVVRTVRTGATGEARLDGATIAETVVELLPAAGEPGFVDLPAGTRVLRAQAGNLREGTVVKLPGSAAAAATAAASAAATR